MRVLIIDNDHDHRSTYCTFLSDSGAILAVALTGMDGIFRAVGNEYDVIVLNFLLPDMTGLEVCRQLRNVYQVATPILMLSGSDSPNDMVMGLEAGADDSMVLPCSLPELHARLKALVRRSNIATTDSVLRFAELKIDTHTGEVYRANVKVPLAPIAYQILVILMRDAPRIVTHEVLEREIWGHNHLGTGTLRAHVHALRSALDKPFSQALLMTLPGLGYRLHSPNQHI
jgi:DNA-binding response OmpR family regulator